MMEVYWQLDVETLRPEHSNKEQQEDPHRPRGEQERFQTVKTM
jgi:hypothetical protein